MDFYNSMLANGAIVETPEELERKRRRQSMGGTLTNNVRPGDDLPSGRQLLARSLKAAGLRPDTTALNEYAAQRVDEGQGAMLNALAAQFAGDSFQPIQAQYLKKAMSLQEPMKIGNYGYAAGGKFVADPYAERDTQAETERMIGTSMYNREEANRQAELDRQQRMSEARMRLDADMAKRR